MTRQRLFAAVLGLFLGVVLLKLGNPVILESEIETPQDFLQLLNNPWPIWWGYIALAVLLLASLAVWQFNRRAWNWMLALPLLWFGWQLISSIETVRSDLTKSTLFQFGACVACFYIGLYAFSRLRNLALVWAGLLAGLAIVLWTGFTQHYGGLEQTRRAYYQLRTIRDNYQKFMDAHPEFTARTLQENWGQYRQQISDQELTFAELQMVVAQSEKLDTPDFQKKIASNRIFSTLFYPNALAGALILLLPVGLVALWQIGRRLPPLVHKTLVGLFAYGGLACLYWSQSKAGWLIALGMLMVVFLRLPVAAKIKWVVSGLVLVAGLSGFALRYAGYFSKGATSAVARYDYWQAALRLTMEKPLLGSGPGSFMAGYKRLKRPESEMTRLAHNDYLQQAADSGFPGFLLYSAFVLGSVGISYRRLRTGRPQMVGRKEAEARPESGPEASGPHSTTLSRDHEVLASRGGVEEQRTRGLDEPGYWIPFAVWLGIIGLAAQSLVEFPLYIPALAWPFFLLLGWLWGRQGAVSSQNSNRQPALDILASNQP